MPLIEEIWEQDKEDLSMRESGGGGEEREERKRGRERESEREQRVKDR